ncbi:MAG: type VII toxin-antitoxin system HepT family RNase toxin [bacterium]
MVNTSLVNKKLQELDKYLDNLKKYEGAEKANLKNDIDRMWAIERGLQLSIQIILDLGNHILSEEGVPVDNYADIFDELARLKIIPEDYAAKIKGMAGFRNVLVHEYADIDLDIIVNVLNNSLDDFKEFAKYVKNHINK